MASSLFSRSEIVFGNQLAEESMAAKKLACEPLATQLTENDLTMPRRKRRSVIISLSYRMVWFSKNILGRKRMLSWCLNTSWLMRRFAFELSSEVFGDLFQREARALSEDVLQRWIPPGGSVLDIGCGPGRWSRLAAQYADSVVGIDQSEVNIKIARQMTTASNIKYVVGDVTQNVDRYHFDVAILVHVIEHIENVDRLLAAISNVASTLIIEVPDFEADPLNMARYALSCPYYSDGDHVREYTLTILTEQLDRNHWNIQHLERRHAAILVVATRTA